jgi:hypothetical protein
VAGADDSAAPGVDPLLLTTTRVLTFQGDRLLTGATGFFFERAGRLFLVTSGHVLSNEASGHRPDRLELTLHTSRRDLQPIAVQSLLLYRDGLSVWRAGRDSGGDVDVAAIELDRAALPRDAQFEAFGPGHLLRQGETVDVGAGLLMIGFPLGFHDTLHHLPVVRPASVASAFGIRFQGQGVFLTDVRAHRGSSGSPLVLRCGSARDSTSWRLLGVHSSRLDMARDAVLDESLGLNSAWYADILMALTGPA